MNYKRLSNEELQKFPYPNLVAEIIESGYGYHTIARFMGHGEESNTEEFALRKLRGETDIFAGEAFGLAKYFGCKLEYMFSEELSIYNGKPKAYWRWLEENKKRREECEKSKAILEIYEELKRKPYLIDFMKYCISLTEEERTMILLMLQEKSECRC